MKTSQLRSTLLAASALSVSIATHLHAATFTSAASGDWSVPASWTAGVLFPDTWNADSAVIAAGHTISYDSLGTSFPFGNLVVANGNSITINGGTLNQTWVPGGSPPFGTAIAVGLNGPVNGNGTLSINLGGTFDSGTANAVAVGVTSTALGAGTGNGIVNVNDGTFFMGAGSSGAGGRGLAIGIDAGAVGVFNLGNGAGAVALLDAATNNALVTIGGRLAEATGGTGTMTIKADGQLNQGTASINVGDDLGTGTLAVDGGVIQGGAGVFRIGTTGGTGTLTMSAGFIDRPGNHDLYLGNGLGSTGVFTQSGGTLDLHGGHFQIGEGGKGTYNISAGTVSNAGWFHVGSGGGSVGTMNVALSNAAGTVTGNQLYVGNNSATGTVTVTKGTLRIDDLGEVGRGGGTGRLDVTGSDARVVVAAAGGDPFFNVGASNGHGIANITGGGQLHTTNTWFTLTSGGGTGEATVSGMGSKLTSKGLIVGWNGPNTGTLTISENAVVENSARELSVGRDNNNTTGIINIGSGGTLNNTGTDAFIGHNGIGIINMSGGAFNNTNTTVLGANPGSVGTLNLTGPGAVTAANFHVGRNGGVGHVVQSAGSVVSNSWSNIGDDGGPGTSDYKISGGSYTVASGGMELGRTRGGSMDVSGTGTVNVNGEFLIVGSHAGGDGSLTLAGGGTVNVNTSNGLVLGYDQNSNGVFTQTGGTLDLNGKYLQVGGSGGVGSGTYSITAGTVNNVGWFHVGSNAGSNGEMNVSMSNPADVIAGSQLYLGNNNAIGTVTVTSGTLRINDVAEIGRYGGTGTLSVIGLNAKVIGGGSGGDPFFKVGREGGHGIVRITGGGKLHTTNTWFTLGENGSVGEATVSGVGSRIDSNGLIVGWNGTGSGTLSITSRGVVTNVGRELSVGRDNAVTAGLININSGGTLNTIEPRIGHNGIGTVNMNNGTFNATGGWTVLGSDGGSANGTVVMSAGSAFNVNGGRVYVGRFGTGSLTLNTGSTFTHTSADQFNIGGVEDENGFHSNFASVGTMTVDATSSVSTTNFIRVGLGNAGANPARGTVNLNGGTINAGNWMGFGHEGGEGTLNMSGGTITNAAEFYVGIDDNAHTHTSKGVANLIGTTPGSITAGTTIWIGRNGGNGTVSISGAAATSLISADVIKIGDGGVGNGGAQTTGTLNIDNPNALVRSANAISVGLNGGIGLVSQTAGSLIETNQWLTLGGGGGSTGTYNLSGGTVTSNFVEVGADGTGAFNIGGTGSVASNQFTVGTRATGVGLVTVNAGGSVVNNGTIFLGGDQGGAGPGSGTLNILGGTVQTTNIIASIRAASLKLDAGTLVANANESDFLRGFSNSGGHSAIVLAGPGGTIDTNGKTVGITAGNVITGTSLRKIGAGTLTIAATQSYATLNQEAGRTELNSALDNATINADGGILVVNASLTNTTVNVAATNSTYFTANQNLAGLNIASGGYVELTDPPVPAPALAFDGGAGGGVSFDTSAAGAAPDLVTGPSLQGVPEPGSISLLLVSALGLLGRRQRWKDS